MRSAAPSPAGRSAALVASLLAATALCVFSQYGFDSHPLGAHGGFWIYQAQTLLHGESPYATSFLRDPPLGPMLLASALALGHGIELPTPVAARVAGVLVGVLNVALLGVFTLRATGSAAAATLAGLCFAAFAEHARTSVTHLDPRSLAVAFTLFTCLALQRRHLARAGAAAALAATSWGPAALLAPVLLAAAVGIGGAPRARRLGRFALGFALGALPAALYLSVSGSWWSFGQRALVVPLRAGLFSGGGTPASFVSAVTRHYATDLAFFAVAAAAFAAFVFTTLGNRKPREGSRCAVGWLRPELGGLPLLTIAWLVWCPTGYRKTVDILPLLPAVAFWPAWWAGRALDAIPSRRLRHGALAVLALAIGAYGYADAFLYAPLDTLAHQMRVLRDILPEDDDPGAVIAFGTESVYALGERRALHPFVRLDERMMPFLPLAYPGGCDELIERTLRAEPAVVLIRNDTRQSKCVFALERRLRGATYERSKVRFEFRRGARFVPDPRDRRRLVWVRFRRLAPPAS